MFRLNHRSHCMVWIAAIYIYAILCTGLSLENDAKYWTYSNSSFQAYFAEALPSGDH